MRISTFFVTIFAASMLFAANPAGVPKEAQQTSPGIYSFRDKDGKVWIYRQTPFGIQKSEEKGSASSPSADSTGKPDAAAAAQPGSAMPTPFGQTRSRAAVPVRVTEDGDTLRFERQTPFGVQRWTRKKSELNETESRLWEAQRQNNNDSKSK